MSLNKNIKQNKNMNFWSKTGALEPEQSIKDVRKTLFFANNNASQIHNIDFNVIFKNFSKLSFVEKLASLDIAVENINIFQDNLDLFKYQLT